MLKNILSFSPNFKIAMGTVVILIVAGAGYFFLYIPVNQHDLEEKQFRCLQNTERNIQEKIDNSLSLLKNLVRNYGLPGGESKGVNVENYIRNYRSSDFRLSLKPVTVRPKNEMGDTTIIFNQDSLYIEIISRNARFGITYTFKQFIDPLLSRGIFDDYLLFSGNKVVYQTFPAGVTQIADSLISNTSTQASRSSIKDCLFSGTAYKLFSHQLNLKTSFPITLTGLMRDDHYQELKTKLPERVVLLLILLAIAVILALPWIKLYQMGSKDRMTVRDGIFSLMVPMLLMSIIFFSFLSYNISFRIGPNATEQITRSLAAHIEKKFTAEVDSAYRVLRNSADIYSSIPLRYPDNKASAKLRTATKGMYISQIFQLNQQGIEVRSWAPGAIPAPPGDYANRQYFTKLRDGSALYLNSDAAKPFYIDQVTSWTRASFTTVMAIPPQKNTGLYTAISFKVKTLDKLITVPGLIYIIIDYSGRVLYHSDTARQLNENLFDEFSANITLKGAVVTYTDQTFITKYANREYNAYVRPFAQLPYSIVTMEDRSYNSVREINNFIFSFSMLFAFFILLALELLIVFMVSVKQSAFKKHYIDVSWVGPNQKFHQQYNVALYGNLAIILLLVVWMALTAVSPFSDLLFMLLSASSISILFQNLLYLDVYACTSRTTEQYKLKRNAVIALGVILLFVNIAAMVTARIIAVALFEVAAIIPLALLWYLVRHPSHTAVNKDENNKAFNYSYSLMTFSRMVISNGLPVMLFYITIANYNIKLVSRYRHAQVIKNIVAGKLPTATMFKDSNLYTDGVWIKRSLVTPDPGALPVSPGEDNINWLFGALTINNNELLPGIDALTRQPNDRLWLYSSLFMTGRAATFYRLADGKYLQMQSTFLKYSLPTISFDRFWYKGATFWFLFAAVLTGFWLMLHNVLRRLFALNLPSGKYWQKLDDLILHTKETNSLVFLIGAPGSGKLTNLKQLISNGQLLGAGEAKINLEPGATEANGYVADMILIPNSADGVVQDNWVQMKASSLDPRYKLIIVNHFEYDIKNAVSNRLKLDFLEELLQRNNGKVIIVSTVHPVNFLDSLNQQGAGDNENADRSPEHDLERWHVLLGHFKIVIQTLTSYPAASTCDPQDWKSVLSYETRRGHFMHNMYQPILNWFVKDKIKTNGLDGDALSLKLGITSHYFYMYIWQSLTKEEKFLLYDLAEDGLVNPYDDYNLVLLISKGIVIKENGQLKLFNGSFRLFILTAIGNSEANQIQRQIKDNGNWNKLKTPLIILIMALLAFLFTSQKEAYSSLLKYATLIAAGVPVILKVLSGFNTSDSKSA